jgi:thiol reductant ABC exporter CydC subunit
MGAINRLLVLVVVGFFIAIGVLLPMLSQHLGRQPGVEMITYRAELHTRLVDSIRGLPDLLAFGRSGDFLGRIACASRQYGVAQRQMAHVTGLQSALSTLLSNLGLWMVLWLSVPQVSSGHLDGVMLAPLALLLLASFEAVTSLPLAAQMWNTSRCAASRLFEIADTHPEVVDRRLGVWREATHARDGSSPKIEFQDVSFSYPGRPEPAMDHVSFALKPGRSVAVVGPSGAGKSTLANLLLRFWEYDSGEICIAGDSIRDYAQEGVRAQIGYVSPNTHFFNTSIRENLRLARQGASQVEIEAAARRAHLHEAILRMPRAYDTPIGELGQRLSGGERQRLAIARLLIKDAPIFLLDEPTANLDAVTEQQILSTLFEVMRHKTTLFITHRLVGLENIDEILVMDRGSIVQRGSHASLLEQDGLYRRLWILQSSVLPENAALHP